MELNNRQRVLFVDDEARILDGLKRSLWNMRNEWDMVFVISGNEALSLLAEKNFDVIVSDMRMPNMNGIQLLSKVHELYPYMIRIVLSGHSDNEMVMQSTKVAHQYLSKPCKADTIKQVIQRSLELRGILENQEIRHLVSQMEQLPSLPEMYYDILDELASSEPSVKKVGQIISRDLGMSAKILQIVNSAFFGLPRHIESSEMAVHLLGLEMVRSLVLSVKIFDLLEDKEIQGFSLSQLWNHSLQVQEFTKIICQKEQFEKRRMDHAVIAGLLHDIGILILIANYHEAYTDIFKIIENTKQPLYEIEKQTFNVDHSTIGAYLLGIWGLPTETIEAVAYHHNPEIFTNSDINHVTAVSAANLIDHQLSNCKDDSESGKQIFLNNKYPDQIVNWFEQCQLRTIQKQESRL